MATSTAIGGEHTPLTTLVTARLRERILSGDISLGERLVEAKLSQELGVSRVPIREALRQLASEGIVTIEPRRGAVVTTYTDEQKRELTEVHASLESLNARLAARRHDPRQIAELESILEEGAQLVAEKNQAALLRKNSQFHYALGRAAGNSVLRGLSETLHKRTVMLFATQCVARADQSWREHQAILRAVREGDEDLAALLAARHVHNVVRKGRGASERRSASQTG